MAADTSSLPLFQTDAVHSPAGRVSHAFDTSVFKKTTDTGSAGLAAAPGVAASLDSDVNKAAGLPVSLANGTANGTEGTTGFVAPVAPLPLTEEPKEPTPAVTAGPSATTPLPIPKDAVLSSSSAGVTGAATTGEKRKAEDALDGASSGILPLAPETTSNGEGEPTAKKAKINAEAVSSGHSAAPVAEVGLVSAPAPATNGGDVDSKKSTKRAKREKKVFAPVGKTARKTRSQGPVDA